MRRTGICTGARGIELIRAERAAGGEIECVAESCRDRGMVELLSGRERVGLMICRTASEAR